MRHPVVNGGYILLHSVVVNITFNWFVQINLEFVQINLEWPYIKLWPFQTSWTDKKSKSAEQHTYNSAKQGSLGATFSTRRKVMPRPPHLASQ